MVCYEMTGVHDNKETRVVQAFIDIQRIEDANLCRH